MPVRVTQVAGEVLTNEPNARVIVTQIAVEVISTESNQTELNPSDSQLALTGIGA